MPDATIITERRSCWIPGGLVWSSGYLERRLLTTVLAVGRYRTLVEFGGVVRKLGKAKHFRGFRGDCHYGTSTLTPLAPDDSIYYKR